MSQENIDFVAQNIYANFQSGNIAGVMDALSDDVVWHYHGPREQIPYAGAYSGKAGAGEQLQTFVGATDTDRVIALIQEGCKVKETGKGYDVLVAHIWTVQGGKIVQFDELSDTCAVAGACQA
jgi:ketosteroid isomerase-like protein